MNQITQFTLKCFIEFENIDVVLRGNAFIISLIIDTLMVN